MHPLVKIQLLDHYSCAWDDPGAATPGSAGIDLRMAFAEPLVLRPGQREAIPCGIRIAIPVGYEGQVRPRSGLALHQGITVLNAPGTIDADYRGEVMVILANLGRLAYTIHPGDRIAQLVVAPVAALSLAFVGELDPTPRGAGGFGSTGV